MTSLSHPYKDHSDAWQWPEERNKEIEELYEWWDFHMLFQPNIISHFLAQSSLTIIMRKQFDSKTPIPSFKWTIHNSLLFVQLKCEISVDFLSIAGNVHKSIHNNNNNLWLYRCVYEQTNTNQFSDTVQLNKWKSINRIIFNILTGRECEVLMRMHKI